MPARDGIELGHVWRHTPTGMMAEPSLVEGLSKVQLFDPNTREAIGESIDLFEFLETYQWWGSAARFSSRIQGAKR